MSKYSKSMLEEELKLHIAEDWFGAYDCKRKIGKIDFCVDIPATELGLYDAVPALWAEAKSGSGKDIHESFVQLILTIGKSKTFSEERPPFFLGAFDAEKIAFLPYECVLDVFTQNDFNWNVAPSDHTTKEFKQLYDVAKSTIEDKSLLYDYEKDETELKKFIKENFVTGQRDVSKIQITRNNFTHIYQKWRLDVLPSLDVESWDILKKDGIIDADFFLADILSDKNNRTIRKKLYVLLTSTLYEVNLGKLPNGLESITRIGFKDGQKAHKQFWNRYSRPPRKDYWDFIVSRRDLLVDQDVRERKGAFFTPRQWVELSQEYLAKELGENWQDEYVIWDCCAGTGNLEAGLTNKYNIWASTLDKADVDVMRTRIKMMEEKLEGSSNLLDSHVFQFDFLNDSFDKLPDGLKQIVDDPEKRKKLVIYINPPYAEVSSKRESNGEKGKRGVNISKTHEKYEVQLGTAGRELFAQFFMRMGQEIHGCKIGVFSKIKMLQGSAFKQMRQFFTAKLISIFLTPADTFDNVRGKFPIAFQIWDTDIIDPFKSIDADIYNSKREYCGTKTIELNDSYINKWISVYKIKEHSGVVGYMDGINGNDFQHNNIVYITNSKKLLPNPRGIWVDASNVMQCTIYLAVRKCVDSTWLNDRDQFLVPNDGWKTDLEFRSNCLCYAIFNNNIQSAHGPNHWIPFTEQEVGAKDCFASHFMSDYIAGKIKSGKTDLFHKETDGKPIVFSAVAQEVLTAGRELWRYYHSQSNANPNASYYDIRKHFQGVKVDAMGKEQMNSTSIDACYNDLLGTLKAAMKKLARQIEPKVYEYGFLKR